MSRENKPKLDTRSLIKYMKSKGITFSLISENDAEQFLDTKNYYFKATSYRSNFPKVDGKYINLDFAYLVELAAIDAQLRRYLFDVAINVEHGLKVKILAIINNNPDEDGYTIVDEFKQKYTGFYETTITYMKKSRYSQDLYNKHGSDPAVWVLLETMSFGALTKFIEFYATKYPSKQLKTFINTMKYAKNIRNAVAHSSPILINLFTPKEYVPKPSAVVSNFSRENGIERQFIQDMKIHDLVALFYLNKQLSSERARYYTEKNGRETLNRLTRHPEYFHGMASIQQFEIVFSQILDTQN